MIKRRLKEGEFVLHQGAVWKVASVSEMRARITPLAKRRKKFQTVEKGAVNGEGEIIGGVEFDAPQPGLDISPYSDLPRVTEKGELIDG